MKSISFTTNTYDKNALSEYCPLKLKEVHLKGRSIIRNVYMDRGLYFEYKTLGVHTGVSKLPLTARGKESVITERIDEQISMFPQLVEKNNMLVTKDNVQVEKIVEIEPYGDIRVFVKLKADLITPISFEGVDLDAAVVDLKLTSDIEKGMWSKYVDPTQGLLYSAVLNLPFFYWVFDYSPYMRNQIRRVITKAYHKPQESSEAQIRHVELVEKIRNTIKIILDHEAHGYNTNSNTRECRNCPLNPDHGGNCDMATRITVM
jgi:hypothetical protein